MYKIDEVITVQGRLVPSKGAIGIKSPVNGMLSNVVVKNGELVRKGQVLIKFDVENAKIRAETIRKQLELEVKKLESQLKSNEKRQDTIIRNIDLSKAILKRLTPLANQGAISEIQILQQENNLEKQKDELIQLQTRQKELVNSSKGRQAELNGNLDEIKNQLKNENVKAPISGIVFELKPDNDSYVTTNAEVLLKIVPEGSLNGEVVVSNKDIGFIHSGQPVKVRIDAFPYTEYGEIDGTVKSIGADALPPNEIIRTYHFPVDLKLDKSSLETKKGDKIKLQAGMTITTNLKLRDRRLISLISDMFDKRSDSIKQLRQP